MWHNPLRLAEFHVFAGLQSSVSGVPLFGDTNKRRLILLQCCLQSVLCWQTCGGHLPSDLPQFGVFSTPDKLLCLCEKFHFPNAASSQFDVMAFN